MIDIPRSQEMFENMRQMTRQKIEVAALSLFARRGLSVKVAEIAEAAGVSQGLMYSHYLSKEALILELVRQAMTISGEYVKTIADGDGAAVDKIKSITDMMCKMFSEAPIGIDYFMFMVQVGMSSIVPKEGLAFAAELPHPAQILANIIAQGQTEGSVVPGDPFQLSIVYWAAIQGLCGYAITGMPVYHEPMVLNRLLIKESKL